MKTAQLVMGWCAAAVICLSACAKEGADFEGKTGPGRGKRIVLLAGDEEYRSEEAMPQLAKILAERHGFTCKVLFTINPTNGTIDPLMQTNLPGLAALDQADLLILDLRFRELPDEQMRHFVDFVNAGKPIIGLRTSTHAFAYSRNPQSPYAKYDYQAKSWPGGFGQQVLGETWVNHHGNHGQESTRGVINEARKNHPVLKGVGEIWGPTDVYTVSHLPADADVLVYGQVLEGMRPSDKPVEGSKNNPMMPLIWCRQYVGEKGKTNRIVTTTMGAAIDLKSEGLRRVLVNACYWLLDIEDQISEKNNVETVGDYKPAYFGFGKFTPGVKPEDLEIK